MIVSECLTPTRAVELGWNRTRTMRNRQEKDEATKNFKEYAAQNELPSKYPARARARASALYLTRHRT
eukprot:7318271-Prymnesium_polylepis.1